MKLLKIVIPCLLLGACMFGTSKSAKFYTLSSTVEAPLCTNYAAFVGVNRVQLPKYMDRPQMITQHKTAPQVNVSEYNRWVEPPAVLATRVLTDNLNGLLPAAQVKINHLKGDKFDKTVTVEIMTLSTVLGEQAELSAWYMVKDYSGKVLTQQKFSSTVKIGKTYDDLAQGCSELLGQLSQEIAGALLQK